MKTFKKYLIEDISDDVVSKEEQMAVKNRTAGRLVVSPIRGYVVGASLMRAFGDRYESPLLKIRGEDGKEIWKHEDEIRFEDEDV